MASAKERAFRLCWGLVLALSLSGWTAYLLFQTHPGTLGDLARNWYTDHVSHMNTARALVFGHVNLWRTPVADQLRTLTDAERAALPPDLREHAGGVGAEAYVLPGTSATKPLVVSWSHYPRFYPPGDAIPVLPVALLYQWTPLSYRGACHALIWLFVLYGHLALFLVGRAAFETGPVWAAGPSRPDLIAHGVLVAAVLAVAYSEVIQWTANGFYDAVALVPWAWAALAISRRRWAEALLGCAAALFLHFRAAFFAPWAAYAVVQLMRERSWRGWRRRQWLMVALAVGLAALSLVTFAWVRPWLTKPPLYNPVTLAHGLTPELKTFLYEVGGLLAFFLVIRAWMDAVQTAWLGGMAVLLHQAMSWHAVLLLPWLVLRPPREGRVWGPLAQLGRLVALGLFASAVFQEPLSLKWLRLL